MKNSNTQRGKTQEDVNKNNSHAEVSLLSISSTLKTQGRDPEQKRFRMTLWNNEAFTLIELLVVVLIIGLLAAVALPQYQFAIVKSRVAACLPVLKSIGEAQERLYLEKGEYTNDISQLDISFQDSCTSYFLINLGGAKEASTLIYCPGKGTSDYSTCNSNNDFIIRKFYKHTTNPFAGKLDCRGTTDLGQRVCNSLKLN